MLDEFRSVSEAPPFLLSDAFVGDLLPLPAHTSLPVPTSDATGKMPKKPPIYIPEAMFLRLSHAQELEGETIRSVQTHSSTRLQCSIDRNTGAAADGALFETETHYLSEGSCPYLTVYLRTERHLDRIIECFHALSYTGFGKKSSVGLGAFTIVGDPEPCPWLDVADDSNAFVSLSHFVPAPTDPTEGWWRLDVTHPKFHANMVSGVFKGVLTRLTPGSAFFLSAPYRPWYGSMLSIPRPEMPGALHYGLCFPIPFRIEEANA